MKTFKTLLKITSALSLATLFIGLRNHQRAHAEPWETEKAPDFSRIKSLEYYLRWDHDKFKRHYAWRLIPPANAELPPRHQKAFALKIGLNHRKKTLTIHYDTQMVTDDTTHRSAKHKGDTTDYDALAKIMAEPVVCTSKIEQGWVGASPEYLKIQSSTSELLIFASNNPKGPAGPTRAVSEKGERRYLCNAALQDWLKEQLQAALKTE